MMSSTGHAGIIDDIYGADFVNGGKDGNIQDQNGHGTFVAGVVGAMTNNGLGVAGINQVHPPPLIIGKTCASARSYAC